MGVDLASLEGTGPAGRVMKADLLAHAEHPESRSPAPTAAPPSPAPQAADEIRPLRGSEKVDREVNGAEPLARRALHVRRGVRDVGADRAAQPDQRAARQEGGQAKLSYLPFITKALLVGFAKYPELNSVMDEEKQALIVKKDVNVSASGVPPPMPDSPSSW